MDTIGNDYNELRSPEYQAVIIVDHNDGRLFPLTENVPTCLLPIANRKLLAYQLDMLSKSNVVGKCYLRQFPYSLTNFVLETFIVAAEEYETMLKQFLAESPTRDAMNVEIISVPDMNGSSHALFSVADRLRGDFFCISCDVISQVSLVDLANLHRLSVSDVTIMLTVPNKDMLKDDVDQEMIGITPEGRIIMKAPILELEEGVSLNKSLLFKVRKPVSLRNDLLDAGIYLFSYWIIEFIKTSYKRLISIKNDLIPYLINRQFQDKEYLFEKIPALRFRKRPLSFLENWLTSKEQKNIHGDRDPRDFRPSNGMFLQTISDYQDMEETKHDLRKVQSMDNTSHGSGEDSENAHPAYARDYLRCHGLIYHFNLANAGIESNEKTSAAASTAPSSAPAMILSRVNTIQTYLNLNKYVSPSFLSFILIKF